VFGLPGGLEMKKALAVLALVGAVGMVAPSRASAHVSVAIGLPGVSVFAGVPFPAPVYVAPPPVYVAPPAVYPVYPVGGYYYGYPRYWGGYYRARGYYPHRGYHRW
jgi:hypothetical protein